MSALWPDYFSLLMDFEGQVYEKDPNDPGGATKFGIDQRSHPAVDIAALTRKAAERIYLSEFAASAASKLPSPFSFVYFDTAVNCGETTAARCLQKSVDVRVDGRIGPETMTAVSAMLAAGDQGKLLGRFCGQRDLYYKNLAFTRSSMQRFLKGWLNRSAAMKQWAAARLGDKGAVC